MDQRSTGVWLEAQCREPRYCGVIMLGFDGMHVIDFVGYHSVRTIPSYKGQRSLPGLYWFSAFNRLIPREPVGDDLAFTGVGVLAAITGLVTPVWAMVAMAVSVSVVLGNSFAGRLLPNQPRGRPVASAPSALCRLVVRERES